MVLTTLAFARYLDDQPLGFIDNEASKYALLRGYSSDDHINVVVATFWGHLHNMCKDIWLERVSSKANPSDETSRDEWLLATAHRWHHVHLQLDHTHRLLLEGLRRPELLQAGLITAMHNHLHAQVERQLGPPQLRRTTSRVPDPLISQIPEI